ncbi:MAG: hypothetical protein R6W76_02985 [Caldilinea sp.]
MTKKVIQLATGFGIAARVDVDRRFEKIRCGHSSGACSHQRIDIPFGVFLLKEDGE